MPRLSTVIFSPDRMQPNKGSVTKKSHEHGRWALHGIDRSTMRLLSEEAKRKHVEVADIIYETVESLVAKCEAEADLENKIIKFRHR